MQSCLVSNVKGTVYRPPLLICFVPQWKAYHLKRPTVQQFLSKACRNFENKIFQYAFGLLPSVGWMPSTLAGGGYYNYTAGESGKMKTACSFVGYITFWLLIKQIPYWLFKACTHFFVAFMSSGGHCALVSAPFAGRQANTPSAGPAGAYLPNIWTLEEKKAQISLWHMWSCL